MEQHRLGRGRLLDTLLAATWYESGVTRIATSNARGYRVFGVLGMLGVLGVFGVFGVFEVIEIRDRGARVRRPDPLKPLVELQYRGVCWTQRNGRDWAVEAFLACAAR